MQRRHHQGEEETKARAKNGIPLPLDGFSMPCKRQALISSLNPYSLPFFIPPHFACRRRQDHVHLFVLFSIAMFTGLGLLFVFLWLFGKQFYKSVHYLVLSNFIGDIEYLLFVLLNSAVWIGYIVRCSYLC